MITDWQVQRRGDELIVGLSTDDAVLDIVSDAPTLQRCLAMLETQSNGLVDEQIGRFGVFPVRLVVGVNNSVSLFIDGPPFDRERTQSSAIWVEKESLREVLSHVIRDEQSN